MMIDFLKRRKLRKKIREMILQTNRRLVNDDDLLNEVQKDSLIQLRTDAVNVSASGSIPEMETFLFSHTERLEKLMSLHGFRRTMRNALDVAAVAFAVAFGIRALYFQPFQIPTSSMQPTLFGIHYVDRNGFREQNNSLVGHLLPFFSERAYAAVKNGGNLEPYYRTYGNLFSTKSDFRIGPDTYTLPGDFLRSVVRYARLDPEKLYQKNEVLADGWLSTGDHLFVERFSIHFVPPKRGDVIVFNTENIKSPTQPIGGYYYIKRLIGLPGDTLKIVGNEVRLKPRGASDFRPLTEFSEHFKKVYSGMGGYQGHLPSGILADGNEITVPDDAYFALGDNTSNSLDGRDWGFIPRRNMIGRALFVFWPISRRWGLTDVRNPVPVKTELPNSMELQ